ncbi:hypothetical protein [Natronospora cellulosivora (SeqCode)]
MHKKYKLLFILFVLVILFTACTNDLQQQLYITAYPSQVSEEEIFSVSGEYINRESSSYEQVEIWLSVKGINSHKTLYSDKIFIENSSQKFRFSDISIDHLEENIYFQLKLIIDANFVLETDTRDNPVMLAGWHRDIKTSYFLAEDAEGNPLKGTWNNDLTKENPFFFALPYRDFYYFVDGSEQPVRKDYYGVSDVKNRWIEIMYSDNGKKVSVYAQWVDVGPWNYYDPYYVFEFQRPYAEIGIDMGWSSRGYRESNKAGLDVSPAVMEYLGEQFNQDFLRKGIIDVNWRFIEEDEVPNGPWKEKISTSSADIEEFNLETQSLRTLND